jgi:hypothetical protein
LAYLKGTLSFLSFLPFDLGTQVCGARIIGCKGKKKERISDLEKVGDLSPRVCGGRMIGCL